MLSLKGLCNSCWTSNITIHIFPIDGITRCKRCNDKMANKKLEEISHTDTQHCENCNCNKGEVETVKEEVKEEEVLVGIDD